MLLKSFSSEVVWYGSMLEGSEGWYEISKAGHSLFIDWEKIWKDNWPRRSLPPRLYEQPTPSRIEPSSLCIGISGEKRNETNLWQLYTIQIVVRVFAWRVRERNDDAGAHLAFTVTRLSSLKKVSGLTTAPVEFNVWTALGMFDPELSWSPTYHTCGQTPKTSNMQAIDQIACTKSLLALDSFADSSSTLSSNISCTGTQSAPAPHPDARHFLVTSLSAYIAHRCRIIVKRNKHGIIYQMLLKWKLKYGLMKITCNMITLIGRWGDFMTRSVSYITALSLSLNFSFSLSHSILTHAFPSEAAVITSSSCDFCYFLFSPLFASIHAVKWFHSCSFMSCALSARSKNQLPSSISCTCAALLFRIGWIHVSHLQTLRGP